MVWFVLLIVGFKRCSFACLTIGTICALWLAGSHGSWLSAQLGILMAEVVRINVLDKRVEHRGVSAGAGRVQANA